LKTAVHFGAGNIGRGFLGQLYFESGYRTVFVDVVEPVVEALHSRHSYPIHIVDENPTQILVEHVDAVNGRDLDAVAEALAAADIASTAVGVNALPFIVPALAKGLQRRFEQDGGPLDIIVCENLIHAGSFLREKVRALLSESCHAALDAKIGFVEASIGRMVPVMTEAQKAEDLLLVCVEPYCELPVDRDAFRGPIPEIAHLKPISNFEAYVERKLFVHNLSHASTAYLGRLRGHEFIWQAIRDEKVRELVAAATAESCEALARRRGLDRAELEEHRLDLVRRYHNGALADQVERVARDPVRKLGPEDRIIGAAKQCVEAGVDPRHIALIAAAAMHYENPDDPGAVRVRQLYRSGGIRAVLKEISRIDAGSPIVQWVADADEQLRREGWIH
jgi:mannitol-1-phosphate 5-dehydrogenase